MDLAEDFQKPFEKGTLRRFFFTWFSLLKTPQLLVKKMLYWGGVRGRAMLHSYYAIGYSCLLYIYI